MIRTSLITAIALAGTLPSLAEHSRGVCGKDPVVMVVNGVTRDRSRMTLYGEALKASGLHERGGSYYLNDPRALRVLEGDRTKNHVTLLIKFPSECAAIRFWKSPVYQQKIMPLRRDAGDFTIELYRLLEVQGAIPILLRPVTARVA